MRVPIPGVGAIKMVNPGGASDWAQVSAAEVVDDDARYLISVVTLNPMTSGVFMLHDAILMANCTNANCIYKIDSGVATPPASGPPVATTAPHVSGSGSVGVALSCDTGTWTNSPTYKFQWKKIQGGNTILLAGETNSVYTPPASERGHDIFCTVTATNSFGNASSDSNHVTIVNLATQEQVSCAAASLYRHRHELDRLGGDAASSADGGIGLLADWRGRTFSCDLRLYVQRNDCRVVIKT